MLRSESVDPESMKFLKLFLLPLLKDSLFLSCSVISCLWMVTRVKGVSFHLYLCLIFLKLPLGTFLVVKWLRHCTLNAGGTNLSHYQGARLHMPQMNLHVAIKTQYSQILKINCTKELSIKIFSNFFKP